VPAHRTCAGDHPAGPGAGDAQGAGRRVSSSKAWDGAVDSLSTLAPAPLPFGVHLGNIVRAQPSSRASTAGSDTGPVPETVTGITTTGQARAPATGGRQAVRDHPRTAGGPQGSPPVRRDRRGSPRIPGHSPSSASSPTPGASGGVLGLVVGVEPLDVAYRPLKAVRGRAVASARHDSPCLGVPLRIRPPTVRASGQRGASSPAATPGAE